MSEDIKEFSDFPEAFQYCYRCGCRVRVMINGVPWDIYPSGRGQKVKSDAVPADHSIGDRGDR